MRNIINISLPDSMVKTINQEVKAGKFSSKSEFFRHLLRLWKERELGEELRKDRKKFEAGKGKTLRSLEDLK